MLFEKSKFEQNDVVTIKLSSGEEVLGKFVSEDMMSITLSKCLMIAMTAKGPAMAPILMTVDPDKDLTFNKNSITVITSSDKEIAAQYTTQTTGIAIPKGGMV
jgi:small nuclear ribonucleoprotein (snRNP)-like protein